MTEPINQSPRPLASLEVALLEHFQGIAVAGQWVAGTRKELAAAIGASTTSVNNATRGLEELGLLEREPTQGGKPSRFRLTRHQPDTRPDTTPDTDPTPNPTPDMSGSLIDASVGAGAQAHGFPPLTPSHGESGNLIPSTTAPDTRHPTNPTPDKPDTRHPTPDTTPIGQLAVRAALEAAKAAGRTVPAATRPRIGHAAQRLAEDESVDTILAAAARLGEGGFEDLYTAVRAVKEARPMPSAVRTAQVRSGPPIDGKMGRVLDRLYQTWPRAQLSPPLWEEKLGRIQERFLIAAVDAIAQEGGDWAPTWGKVWKVAHEIGQPAVLAERAEAAYQREQARMQASS